MLFVNAFNVLLIFTCAVFMVPLLILVCIQTKNMASNETTSERFGKKKDLAEKKEEAGGVGSSELTNH